MSIGLQVCRERYSPIIQTIAQKRKISSRKKEMVEVVPFYPPVVGFHSASWQDFVRQVGKNDYVLP